METKYFDNLLLPESRITDGNNNIFESWPRAILCLGLYSLVETIKFSFSPYLSLSPFKNLPQALDVDLVRNFIETLKNGFKKLLFRLKMSNRFALEKYTDAI